MATNIKYMLAETDWSTLASLNVEDCFERINYLITNDLDRYGPDKEVVIQQRHIEREPWLSKALLKSQRKKLQLYRKSIRLQDTHPSRLTYRRYRNIYNRLRKTAKKDYFSNQLDEFKNNTRQTWNIYRQFLGKINDKRSVTDYFVIDGKESNDKTAISEGFNNFFANVGASTANKVQTKENNFKKYLSENYNTNLFFHPTDVTEINQIISDIKPKKSSGIDNINAKLLKEISNAILEPLSIAINKSIQTSTVPNCMKIAKVVPIFNKRPIGLGTLVVRSVNYVLKR